MATPYFRFAESRSAPTGQARDSRHLGIGIPATGGDVVGRHRGRVGAPEQLVADRQRRYAEYAARNGVVGVPAQRVLDLGAGDALRSIGETELGGQLGPFDRQIPQASVAPDETEDRAHRFGRTIGRNRQPQQRQRIERMDGRELERYPELTCLPDDEPVGKAAFRGNLRRAEGVVCLEQAGEQHGPVAHAKRALERGQLLALKIRKRRDKVKVPVSARHQRRGGE